MKQWLTKKISRERIDAFIQKHASTAHTLDLGSSWSPYAKYFPDRVSSDIEPRDGVDVVADAHALPFKDGEFSVILCSEVLEHLHTPEQAIAEMWRVLEPGGSLILTTRFMMPMHDMPHDYFRYTKTGMEHLFREWEIDELVPETINFETIGFLIHRMAMMMDFRGGKVTRIVLYLFAKCISKLGFLVIREYGKRRQDGNHYICNTFASGFYLYAKKPLS